MAAESLANVDCQFPIADFVITLDHQINWQLAFGNRQCQ
jgi:hypothetical protein